MILQIIICLRRWQLSRWLIKQISEKKSLKRNKRPVKSYHRNDLLKCHHASFHCQGWNTFWTLWSLRHLLLCRWVQKVRMEYKGVKMLPSLKWLLCHCVVFLMKYTEFLLWNAHSGVILPIRMTAFPSNITRHPPPQLHLVKEMVPRTNSWRNTVGDKYS